MNMSHNRIYTLDGIKAFVGVHVLNLAYNRLVSGEDVSKVLKLRRLATLGLEGKTYSHTYTHTDYSYSTIQTANTESCGIMNG